MVAMFTPFYTRMGFNTRMAINPVGESHNRFVVEDEVLKKEQQRQPEGFGIPSLVYAMKWIEKVLSSIEIMFRSSSATLGWNGLYELDLYPVEAVADQYAFHLINGGDTFLWACKYHIANHKFYLLIDPTEEQFLFFWGKAAVVC
eukprot:scaffold2012_cov193-Cylindrotheca_fusiformis.AAC.1